MRVQRCRLYHCLHPRPRCRIETGERLAGERISTIGVLLKENVVARDTVRQALRVPERKLLTERLSAKGTFAPPGRASIDCLIFPPAHGAAISVQVSSEIPS
ncbi:MAG: hypothetical protein WD767_10800 [Alphaproteobacteria bacterium]